MVEQTLTDGSRPRNPLSLQDVALPPGRGPVTPAIFTFDTTHHALWAEEVARGADIPAEVVPAPPAARARCNLALETLPEEVERLAGALAAEGVPHARWPPPRAG